MRSIQELKAEIEALQRQLDEARERDRSEAVERVRELCKDFDITPSMLKGYLVDGRAAPRGPRKNKTSAISESVDKNDAEGLPETPGSAGSGRDNPSE